MYLYNVHICTTHFSLHKYTVVFLEFLLLLIGANFQRVSEHDIADNIMRERDEPSLADDKMSVFRGVKCVSERDC